MVVVVNVLRFNVLLHATEIPLHSNILLHDIYIIRNVRNVYMMFIYNNICIDGNLNLLYLNS